MAADKLHTFKSNAVRDAKQMLAKGVAPGEAFTIEKLQTNTGIRFRAVWSEKREAKAPRTGSKQATVVALLQRPDGATVPEIMAETGWLPHTTRGFIAGTIKRKLGLAITAEKIDGRGHVYRAT